MAFFVSLYLILACGYGAIGDSSTTTETTTNGGPDLLHIISSTAPSTSNSRHPVTSSPNYTTGDDAVTSDTTHGQTGSQSQSSVTPGYENSTSGHTTSKATTTPGYVETLDVDDESTTFQISSQTSTQQTESSSPESTSSTTSTHTTTMPAATKSTSASATTIEHSVTPDTTVGSENTSSSTTGTSQLEESLKKGHDNPFINSTRLSIFGVCIGLAGAVFIITIAAHIHMTLRNSWKKKICLNGDAKRTDWLKVRRFTINDVKASLGGIPANGDIWLEMNKDSSVVL